MEIVEPSWTLLIIPAIILSLFYLLVIFLVIWGAIRVATKDQRKQLIIANKLQALRLKHDGISERDIRDALES